MISRRELLCSVSVASITFLSGQAIAWPVRGSLPDFQISNVNSGNGAGSLDYKFLNFASGGTRIITNGGPSDWYTDAFINDDCYPVETTYGVNFSVDVLPGTFIIRWKGSGSVVCNSGSSKTNSSKGIYTGGGSNGSIVTNGRYTLVFSSSATVTITVKGTTINGLGIFFSASEEDLYDSGQMYRPDHISAMQAYKGVLRLGIQDININGQGDWKYRPLISQITWNGRFFGGRKLGAASGTNDYTISDTSSYTADGGFPASPTHGTVVHFRVPSGQQNTSTSCTLQIGAWPAKTYTNSYLTGIPVGGTLNTNTAVYDSVLDKWLCWPGTGAYGLNWYSVIGIPWEAQIQECNETGRPGWLLLPYWISDDAVAQLATLICTHPYQPKTIYVEYVNEIWNFSYGFPFTTIAAQYGGSILGLGGGNGANYSGWYGYRMRQIRAIIQSVFSGYAGAPQLNMVLASQGSAGDNPATLAAVIENTRFQQAGVPALSGANAPINNCDVVSYALYWGSNAIVYADSNYNKYAIPYFPTLSAIMAAYLAGDKTTAFNLFRDDIINKLDMTSPSTGGAYRFQNWNTLAASYAKPVRMYEFNWEMGYPSADWCKGGSVVLFANSNKLLSTNNSAAVGALGFLQTSSWLLGGGDTLSASPGLAGYSRLNKLGGAISGATLLSGSAGTDSITSNFSAGDTITIAGSGTITFVASGASGNSQCNITDSVAVLLSKIDALTGTTTPSTVRSMLDSSYGDVGGTIWAMILEFYSSQQAIEAVRAIQSSFYSFSRSRGMSLLGYPGNYPWFTFNPASPSSVFASATAQPLAVWTQMGAWNNGTR